MNSKQSSRSHTCHRQHRVVAPALSLLGPLSALRGVLLAGCVAGCAPMLPKAVFSIDGTAAHYPLMISRTAARTPGRRLVGSGGVQGVGDTITGQDTPASSVLETQVQLEDQWLQLEAAEFVGVDTTTYFMTFAQPNKFQRTLILSASAHRDRINPASQPVRSSP